MQGIDIIQLNQMIITTINNNKLFIKFDSLVKSGLIHISDNKDFRSDHPIENSDFEMIDLPQNPDKIFIQIEFGKEKFKKTIILKSQ